MGSQQLTKAKVQHNVLNAKENAREAQIIADAGRPAAVTIATNMAGRGTDIMLGGNWEAEVAALEDPSEEQIAAIKADWQKRHDQVLENGGLHIIGTERHESRKTIRRTNKKQKRSKTNKDKEPKRITEKIERQ